jgi:hypothetical protein
VHIKDLIESQPKTTTKDRGDSIPADLYIHARLVAALSGTRVLGLKPLAEVMTLDETKPKAKLWDVEIPAGTHEKLAEALTGPTEKLPENMHDKAARALTR